MTAALANLKAQTFEIAEVVEQEDASLVIISTSTSSTSSTSSSSSCSSCN